ncbi:MAG TPA: hypothetical protein DCW90_05340 [Lachnospiraceae bacterium]|nr:hypothetical protein [Lachnospiraceae bacterium]
MRREIERAAELLQSANEEEQLYGEYIILKLQLSRTEDEKKKRALESYIQALFELYGNGLDDLSEFAVEREDPYAEIMAEYFSTLKKRNEMMRGWTAWCIDSDCRCSSVQSDIDECERFMTELESEAKRYGFEIPEV